MIAKATSVTSVKGAEKYLEQERDNLKRKRAGIQVTGTHTKEEFHRLVEIVGSRACPIEHHIFAYGAKAHGPITTRRGNDIIASFERLAYAGLIVPPPSLHYRHFEPGGGYHDHNLPLRFEFMSGKQFSLFPRPTDVYLVQLWQTAVNVQYGMSDPFDPAYRRDFAQLPYRLSHPIQLLAEKAKQYLSEARDAGLVKDNPSGRDYLAAVHGIQTHLRHSCLFLQNETAWVQITTPAFAREKPDPLRPGAWRPWFTIDDRELLELATKYRTYRHLNQYPVMAPPHAFQDLFFTNQLAPIHEKTNQTSVTATIAKAPTDSPEQLSGNLALIDVAIAAMRQRERNTAAIRRADKELKESFENIERELTEWRKRARNLHFGLSRPIRNVAKPIPGPGAAEPDSPAAPVAGPSQTTPPIAQNPAPVNEPRRADDSGPLSRPKKTKTPRHVSREPSQSDIS